MGENNKRKDITPVQKKSDTIANRMMVIFVASLVAIVSLLLVNKNFGKFVYKAFYEFPFVEIAGLLVLAAGIVFFVMRKKKGTDETYLTFTSTMALVGSAVICIFCLAFRYILINGVVIGLVVVSILTFVFWLYNKDFFAYSLITAVSALCLAAIGGVPGGGILKTAATGALTVLAFLLPVLTAAAVIVVKKNGGKLILRGKKRTVMPKDGSYYPFAVTAGVTLAAAVLSLFVPGAELYGNIALLASYLVIAIVYTVKMI